MAVEPGFWRGKKVLVTGHTGFKGSWLSLWLQTMGAGVVGYSAGVPSIPSLFDLAKVGDGMVSLEGDVRDLERVRRVFSRYRPEIVIHLAAQAIVRRSFREPAATYETNVMGTVYLLECVREVGDVRVVVNVTSDKCYESLDEERGYREDDPKGGADPYSNSKGCAELATEAYRRSFFNGRSGETRIASARAGNVIGGGDWGEDRLVPDIFRSALERRPLLIRNPDAVRPWQHVLNPLSGYLLLAEKLWEDRTFAEGWNFGPDERDEKAVRWLVEEIRALWGDDLSWEEDRRDRHPREVQSLKLDSSKARARLGWRPRWSLEETVRTLVDWYSAYQAGSDMRAVVLDQIRAFEETPAAAPTK